MPVDEWHHIEEVTRSLARIEERKHVRVVQLRRRPYFGEKTLRSQRRREVRMKHLDGHQPTMPEIFCQIHCGHATRAKFALNPVTV